MASMLICSVLVLGGLVGLVAFYWGQFAKLDEGYTRERFGSWVARGLGGPVLIWLLLNWGTMPFMPPLNVGVAGLRADGRDWLALLVQTFLAALPIFSYWAALSFGWFLHSIFRKAKNHDDLIIASAVWSPVLLFLVWFFNGNPRWAGEGFALVLWMWPLAHYLLNEADVYVPPPSYSQAIGKIKFGKYGEAEAAIIGELEKAETDFEGWMMLAELYARQYHDLAEAERTIYGLCAEPGTMPSQVSLALQRLAEWHLNLGGNPLAARRVLEDLCERAAGTHLALMARQRLKQIPESQEAYDESKKPHTFAMPAMVEPTEGSRPVDKESAMVLVNELVGRLNGDPNDAGSREKLARVFGDGLGKFELAIEQVELLLGMADQPERNVAEWLAMKGSWLLRVAGREDEGKAVLEGLVREFPQSAQAFGAQRRLKLLEMEGRLRAVRKPGG